MKRQLTKESLDEHIDVVMAMLIRPGYPNVEDSIRQSEAKDGKIEVSIYSIGINQPLCINNPSPAERLNIVSKIKSDLSKKVDGFIDMPGQSYAAWYLTYIEDLAKKDAVRAHEIYDMAEQRARYLGSLDKSFAKISKDTLSMISDSRARACGLQVGQ